MELLWQVDEAGAHIKEKDGLINQLETKLQDLEEDKHRSEARCCKAMQDIECMKVEMGQERYGDCIKYGCQTNLDESSHTIEKLRKLAEKVEFEDKRHLELIM